MKICPECGRQFADAEEYCSQDGVELEEADASDAPDPFVGRVIDGRWQIVERLGQGGTATVYLARQESLGREAAIKVLRPSLAATESFKERFLREAQFASDIDHEHCVTVYDVGETGRGELYLAMERLDGSPLGDKLSDEGLALEPALKIAGQVAEALVAAHDQGIVHRDLKPDNVFLTEQPDGSVVVKVLDFGISKRTGDDSDLTKTGEWIGTPHYMSPEQCRGDDLDRRSDLYSLGCLLFEMLTGMPPFRGTESLEILMAHLEETPPAPSDVADDLPRELDSLVGRLLAKDPADRPPSAEAVKQRIASLPAAIESGDGAPKSTESASSPPPAAESDPLDIDHGHLTPDTDSDDDSSPSETSTVQRENAEPTRSSTTDSFGWVLPLVGAVAVGGLVGLGIAIGADGADRQRETPLSARTADTGEDTPREKHAVGSSPPEEDESDQTSTSATPTGEPSASWSTIEADSPCDAEMVGDALEAIEPGLSTCAKHVDEETTVSAEFFVRPSGQYADFRSWGPAPSDARRCLKRELRRANLPTSHDRACRTQVTLQLTRR